MPSRTTSSTWRATPPRSATGTTHRLSGSPTLALLVMPRATSRDGRVPSRIPGRC
ncbi:hypothetical protein ACFPRL_23555 [Pseudoclavibacter helvolus]